MKMKQSPTPWQRKADPLNDWGLPGWGRPQSLPDIRDPSRNRLGWDQCPLSWPESPGVKFQKPEVECEQEVLLKQCRRRGAGSGA